MTLNKQKQALGCLNDDIGDPIYTVWDNDEELGWYIYYKGTDYEKALRFVNSLDCAYIDESVK